ncbi:PBP1A family penicillin-binding protein [Tepidibacillus fermentans]|uniref:Penicillin-binding protein n=1 Tax=Tepidibacillus fermentans TaxID=1281767 RepID=A0A4R3KDY9_9BACI|nr:PBP1A family penicillin-binding protein [Tepidibacillus fermentans]TCS81300.1 penicillin-binding protein [Tepidibacillus fermentans]
MSQTNSPNKNKNRKREWKHILKYGLIALFVMIFLGIGTAAGLVAAVVKDEPVRSDEEIRNQVFKNNLVSSVFWADGEKIGDFKTDEVRVFVPYDQISDNVKNAVIAIEDRDFRNHNGINLKAIARAALQQLSGSEVQTGGSTITQQLAKNTFFSLEKTYTRKTKEILLALRMERVLSKDEILTAYLNKIPFGKAANLKNVYGIQAAARGYFNKDAKDLNVAEAAYLAGIPQRPTAYSAFNQNGFDEEGYQLAKKRQELVLKAMLTEGFINQQQYDEAINYDIKAHFHAETGKKETNKYGYLMQEIETKAAQAILKSRGVALDSSEYDDAFENAKQELVTGGYKIYTTLDKKIYEAMNEVVNNPKNFPRPIDYTYQGKRLNDRLLQVGATLIHNKTGAILGSVGGRDFENYQVNHAAAKRQPGSSIKPVLDYAPALELGKIQPATPIDDIPLGQKWEPNNYDGRYHGRITARVALNKSYNIPAVKVYQMVGTEKAYEFYKKLGYEISEKRFMGQGGAAAIGSLEASPEEMASAYSTFGNGGTHMDAYVIEKIEDRDGKVIYAHESKPEAVFSEQTAFLITDMLRTVMTEGTGTTARKYVSGRDVAGKTGTTNDEKDLWFIGYTPTITLSVWTGYDLPYPVKPHSIPQDTWGRLMQAIFKADPTLSPSNARFDKPSGIVRMTVSSASGKLPSDLTKKGGYLVTDWFNQKYVPTQLEDGLGEARLIMFNNTTYVAKPETPDEFVDTGIFLIREPYKIPPGKSRPLDYQKEMPKNNDPRTSTGKPAPPSNLSVNGNVISWSKNTNQNIVGYRIYRASADGIGFAKIGVVRQTTNSPGIYTFTDSAGSGPFAYYVTAVDVAGLESDPSNIAGKNPEPTEPPGNNPDEPTNPGNPNTALPQKPTGLNVSSQGGHLVLSWNPNPYQDQVIMYSVYYSTSKDGKFDLIYQGIKNSTTINPKNKVNYYYVVAKNNNGETQSNIFPFNLE